MNIPRLRSKQMINNIKEKKLNLPDGEGFRFESLLETIWQDEDGSTVCNTDETKGAKKEHNFREQYPLEDRIAEIEKMPGFKPEKKSEIKKCIFGKLLH
jgi:hypothetical protein